MFDKNNGIMTLMQDKGCNRRDFLKYSLTALLALNFGCSIKGLIGEDKKAALIYGTKYGSTRDTAGWIRKGTGLNIDLIDAAQMNFNKTVFTYDCFVVGSGVWIDGIHGRLKEFLTSESIYLKQRVLASFVVCGTQDTTEGGRRRIKKYLDQMHSPMGYEPELSIAFGGRVILEQLTPEDREALTNFYRKYLNQELVSWDRTDEQKTIAFGKKLGPLIESCSVEHRHQ